MLTDWHASLHPAAPARLCAQSAGGISIIRSILPTELGGIDLGAVSEMQQQLLLLHGDAHPSVTFGEALPILRWSFPPAGRRWVDLRSEGG